MTVARSVLVALLLMALAPAAALAAPPPNDARAAATTIAALPSTQSGTTAEATTEPAEPRSPCFCNAGSVWYRYVAATDGRLVLTLTAAGDLAAPTQRRFCDNSAQEPPRLTPRGSTMRPVRSVIRLK